MADEQGTTIVIKKIKKGGHGHHGGAWKVAYADFVTAMMAFFLVMWIIGMSQETKEGIQQYFNDPLKALDGSDKISAGIFETTVGQQLNNAPKRGGVMDSNQSGGLTRLHLLAQKIEAGMSMFKQDISGIQVRPDRIQFAITAQSLFSAGSDLIKPEAEPLLARIANILQNTESTILIEAHTDDIPPENPNYETNWELSAARATKIVRYFVEGHHIDPTRITPMGQAQYRPIADNSTPEGRAKNRRIDVYIIPDKDNRLGFRSTASDGVPPTKSE
ncbi:MAG: flagellar motor protein MotB [Bdellovibrionales bacterium]|nr:flagellar motor protein MotB [Bdellovibrionales bacterium]